MKYLLLFVSILLIKSTPLVTYAKVKICKTMRKVSGSWKNNSSDYDTLKREMYVRSSCFKVS